MLVGNIPLTWIARSERRIVERDRNMILLAEPHDLLQVCIIDRIELIVAVERRMIFAEHHAVEQGGILHIAEGIIRSEEILMEVVRREQGGEGCRTVTQNIPQRLRLQFYLRSVFRFRSEEHTSELQSPYAISYA